MVSSKNRYIFAFDNFVKHKCQTIMSVEEKNKDATYELIINTAKNILFKEGKFNVTTQEIADAAGVNRTLINYYFRSRNSLFDLVYLDAKKEEDIKREMIVFSDMPLREKMEQFMDHFFESSQKYPYIEMFIVNHMNKHNLCLMSDSLQSTRILSKFYAELEHEMAMGNIHKMDPVQFVINFIAMLSYPIAMRPLIQQGMGLSDADYNNILADRKEVILKTIFKN